MVYKTMTQREEAAWRRAVLDGTLWEYQDEWEASEQMWLWRMAGNTLKETGHVYGLTPGAVWARVKSYEARR